MYFACRAHPRVDLFCVRAGSGWWHHQSSGTFCNVAILPAYRFFQGTAVKDSLMSKRRFHLIWLSEKFPFEHEHVHVHRLLFKLTKLPNFEK
jgi:hypothetical protein